MRVLIVADNARRAAMIRKGLRNEGFAVDQSTNAKDALKRAVSRNYNAILLDLRRPKDKGRGFLRALRRREDAVPLMIVTSPASVDERVKALNFGADDCLATPFDFRELLARLRAIVRRPLTPPRTVLKIADLTLDPVKKEVTRAGRRISLSPKEVAFLEYLLRNSGITVTHDMILDHVWDLGLHRSQNLIETYVNLLRAKIEKEFAPKLIHTVRGTGYVVRADNEEAPTDH